EGHAGDGCGVRLQGAQDLAGRRIPYLHSFIMRASGQPAAVGAIRHAGEFVMSPLQREEGLPRGGVPNLDGPVIRGGRQAVAVGMKGKGSDPASMPAEGESFSTGGQFPALYQHSGPLSEGKVLPILGEGNTGEHSGMSVRAKGHFAGRSIPNRDTAA